MSPAVLIAAAIVLTIVVLVLLLAVTGGPRTLFAEHDLPEPRTAAPRRRAD